MATFELSFFLSFLVGRGESTTEPIRGQTLLWWMDEKYAWRTRQLPRGQLNKQDMIQATAAHEYVSLPPRAFPKGNHCRAQSIHRDIVSHTYDITPSPWWRHPVTSNIEAPFSTRNKQKEDI